MGIKCLEPMGYFTSLTLSLFLKKKRWDPWHLPRRLGCVSSEQPKGPISSSPVLEGIDYHTWLFLFLFLTRALGMELRCLYMQALWTEFLLRPRETFFLEDLGGMQITRTGHHVKS